MPGDPAGQIVGLLGANGAGKTTLLRALCSQLPHASGSVNVAGTDLSRMNPAARSRSGLCMIPEGGERSGALRWRRILPCSARRGITTSSREALSVFPSLTGRLKALSGKLSGGLQQQLALARCYIARPRVILVDEVSMGLAPMVIDQIFQSFASQAASGISMLIVEQYVDRVFALAENVAVLHHGKIAYYKAGRGSRPRTNGGQLQELRSRSSPRQVTMPGLRDSSAARPASCASTFCSAA
jgi:branched-chain amino acid transport system ATP-binding protein